MANTTRRRLLRLAAVGQELAGKVWARARGPDTSRPAGAPKSAPAGLEGLRVAVTGGTQGVGLAVAKGFAEAGARVAIIGRDARRTSHAATEIGHDALGISADLSRPRDATAAFDAIAAKLGGLDLLINNAGIPGETGRTLWELPEENFAEVMQVNATGAFLASARAAAIMQDQGSGGRIVNVSSGAVDGFNRGMGAYAVSKHALEGLSRQLSADGGLEGIVSCTLRLGSVRTRMTEQAFGAVKASLLPEPESVVPAFFNLATAPSAVVNGRSFAAWRLLDQDSQELIAPTPLVAEKTFAYPTYVHNGREVERGGTDFRIFDRAENPFGASPNVAEAILRDLSQRSAAVYPDEAHQALKSALAETHGLTEAHFSIGNGSWEVLDRILEVFTHPGDEVVAEKPGWFGFNMLCKKRGLVNRKIPMTFRDGRPEHDLQAIAAAAGPATRLIYLISPSNPEGVVLKRDGFRAFLDALPEGLPLILDEAYLEYNGDSDAISARDILDNANRPVFGLRTFSKFYGLASMRVGYAYALPEYADLLNRAERIFSISHLSERAAIAALADTDHQAAVLNGTLEQRQRLEEGLRELKLDFIPSQAPYVLAELPGPLKDVVDLFAREGIILGEKAFYKSKYFMLPVSVPEDTGRILDLLGRCIRELR